MAESQHWSQAGMRKWDSSDGTSTQNRPFRKFQNWILKHQFMRMHMQTVLTNKQNHHTSWHEQAIASPQIPEPVSSMLPDRFCSKNTKKWIETEETNASALRICFLPLKYQTKVMSLPMTMSAMKFDKMPSCCDSVLDQWIYRKIGENPAVVSLSIHVAIAPSRFLQLLCNGTFQDVSKCDSAWYIDWFLTLYLHEVDPTWRSKTAFGWICRSMAHWDIHIAWVLQCKAISIWRRVWPQRCNGAMFCCLPWQSEVPCRLRCEIVQTYGGEIHWLRFMLQICGKYESARANQQHWPIISPVFPTTLVEAMWDVWLYDDVSSALKQWYA